jgi:hypothetical protein
MVRHVILFLLVVGFFGCSQQTGEVGDRAGSDSLFEAPARVRRVWIEPANPTSRTDLKAEVVVRGELGARVNYQWLKDNTPIPGAIEETLSTEHFSRGDLISVEVWVVQSERQKHSATSEVILVGNTPPVVNWAAIGPAAPTSTTDLTAVARGRDLDNDDVTYSYRWMVNGETVVGPEGPSLSSSHFGRGDEVQVTAIPFDGTDWGQPGDSITVTIQNSPPAIKSTPPGELQEGTTYCYQVQAEDADGDTLRFSLQGEPPKGMMIDAKTGVLQWQVVTPETPVTYVYEVVVEDPEGAKSIQKITLKSPS